MMFPGGMVPGSGAGVIGMPPLMIPPGASWPSQGKNFDLFVVLNLYAK